jgi:hypothetical protein
VSNEQVQDPATDNPGTADVPGAGGSLLTGVVKTPTEPLVQPQESTPPWKSQLSKPLQAEERLNKFNETGFTGLAESYLELEGKIGRTITVPDEKASAQEKEAFYAQLGRPEKAEDYALDRPQLPDGLNYSEQQEKDFKELAHKLGVSQDQAKELNNFYNGLIVKQFEEAKATREAARVATRELLGGEWKGDFDANMKYVQRAYAYFGGEEVTRAMEITGAGDNADVIRMFAKIGKEMAEDTLDQPARGVQTVKDPAKVLYPEMT